VACDPRPPGKLYENGGRRRPGKDEEQSCSNASLLTAYYLAAAQGRKIKELLENVAILFDPSFDPDGMQRFPPG